MLLTAEEMVAVSRPNIESNIKVVKLQIFNGIVNKISKFLMAYK